MTEKRRSRLAAPSRLRDYPEDIAESNEILARLPCRIRGPLSPSERCQYEIILFSMALTNDVQKEGHITLSGRPEKGQAFLKGDLRKIGIPQGRLFYYSEGIAR
jgi:hypothetical protein